MVRTDAQEYFRAGSVLQESGNFDDALMYYQKALDYLKSNVDKKTEADTLMEVGNIYVERDDYEKGIKYYENSWKFLKKLKMILVKDMPLQE